MAGAHKTKREKGCHRTASLCALPHTFTKVPREKGILCRDTRSKEEGHHERFRPLRPNASCDFLWPSRPRPTNLVATLFLSFQPSAFLSLGIGGLEVQRGWLPIYPQESGIQPQSKPAMGYLIASSRTSNLKKGKGFGPHFKRGYPSSN